MYINQKMANSRASPQHQPSSEAVTCSVAQPQSGAWQWRGQLWPVQTSLSRTRCTPNHFFFDLSLKNVFKKCGFKIPS